MPNAWRITHRKYAKSAFDGEGARLCGGCWTSIGVPAVYVSENLALATLEVLVHLQDYKPLRNFVFFEIEFPAIMIHEIDRNSLPRNWRSSPAPRSLQAIGDRWARERISAVLSVPSATLERAVNFVLNPLHDDFQKINIIEGPLPLRLDRRIVERGK